MMETPIPNSYIVRTCPDCQVVHAPIRQCFEVGGSLANVYEGLQKGRSYKHHLEGGGWEYVRPIGGSMFTHTVAGENEYGGYGGQADLNLDVLRNGRWDLDGWIPE